MLNGSRGSIQSLTAKVANKSSGSLSATAVYVAPAITRSTLQPLFTRNTVTIFLTTVHAWRVIIISFTTTLTLTFPFTTSGLYQTGFLCFLQVCGLLTSSINRPSPSWLVQPALQFFSFLAPYPLLRIFYFSAMISPERVV